MTAPILIDADGVLCDFINPFLDMANKVTGLNKTVHDLAGWDMLPMYPPEKHAEILENLVKPGWCLGLKPYPGAREAVEELRTMFKVYCVTAPWTSETWCWERTKWLIDNMGFDKHEVIHAHDKWLIHGHTLIDDKAETLVKWCEATGMVGILITQPYNKGFNCDAYPSIWRADNWEQVLEFVQEI